MGFSDRWAALSAKAPLSVSCGQEGLWRFHLWIPRTWLQTRHVVGTYGKCLGESEESSMELLPGLPLH